MCFQSESVLMNSFIGKSWQIKVSKRWKSFVLHNLSYTLLLLHFLSAHTRRIEGRIDEYLVDAFGKSRASQSVKSDPIEENCPLPSRNDLNYRILIKNKKVHQNRYRIVEESRLLRRTIEQEDLPVVRFVAWKRSQSFLFDDVIAIEQWTPSLTEKKYSMKYVMGERDNRIWFPIDKQ